VTIGQKLLHSLMVKAIVVSKLFELAGFYDAPYRVKSEASITIAAIVENDDYDAAPKTLRGRIDFLVLQNQFWQAVIESKETTFDIENGIPQILRYMVGMPSEQNTGFGMVTNGTNFIFIKLQRGNSIVYDFSDVFSMLSRDNCLYPILQILKKIGAITIA
jgi:Type I restriction enzyme R protein N terminus (HSDR_N)